MCYAHTRYYSVRNSTKKSEFTMKWIFSIGQSFFYVCVEDEETSLYFSEDNNDWA